MLWTIRFTLLAAGLGVLLSFAKGDGPAPAWSPMEQAAQSAAGALVCGSVGAALGLVFDLIGGVRRRARKFSQDMQETEERLSHLR
ncbi:MAG: hypothetical protein KF760_24050 [Candidatus Eremiobacteraeota bacterium]|nr:hypothetical protein [Candidatus Eremiobacteraeota bacterium]MCW5866573.1 hypothetical protein [Candidatus Eremiobacteraeota bacterium]